jgi:hypothetical protein
VLLLLPPPPLLLLLLYLLCSHPRSLRGKVLAAFLKCIGFIIPLMDGEHAYYYTREVMVVLKREFSTADEEMKKIVLKVVQQCVGTEGVEAGYVKTEVLPEFFRAFWQRRMALDRRNYRALVETTVSLADKVSLCHCMDAWMDGCRWTAVVRCTSSTSSTLPSSSKWPSSCFHQ